ncbi:TRAP transporter substrate-binding protein DctP [Anoxynatronum sibiricum]|uniref:TRAP transporter substrate-binding protein DctP n=1 Tax=Anoxynatronum sibiricum TaxID=210623 RepID=A0ABU9VP78_9CLOT
MKKRNRNKTILLSIFLCITLLLTACGGSSGDNGGQAASDEPMVLRLATDHPVDHMATRSANAIAEEVEEKTNGRIKINIYPASQLGGYDTVYEEIVRGTIDMAHITIPDSLDSRLGAAYTPYLTTGYEEAKVVYAPGSFLSEKFVEYNEALGVKFLGFYLEGYIGMSAKKEPRDLLVPGANKGLQMRVWAAPAAREPMADLGYTPVTVPYAEAPTAIQTGVVDGWIGGTPNVNYHWVGEIIDYFWRTYMHAESTAYVMNQKLFDSLSAEDQQIILDAFERQSKESFELAEAEDEHWMEQLEELGVTVVKLSDDEVQMLADFVRTTTWPKLESVYTSELLDGLKAQYE